jgi:hypothetical protein
MVSSMTKPGFYAIVPADVRYNKSLPMGARMLYGELTALCNQEGYCWATNAYFSELYEVGDRTISSWVSKLKEAGHIDVQMILREGSKQVQARHITIASARPIEEILHTPRKNLLEGVEENFHTPTKKTSKGIVQANNTNNNTSNKRFAPPTVFDVQVYCNEKQYSIDAEHFVNYYEARGWMLNKVKMKSWKAALATWVKRDQNKKVPAKNAGSIKNRNIAESLSDRSWAYEG